VRDFWETATEDCWESPILNLDVLADGRVRDRQLETWVNNAVGVRNGTRMKLPAELEAKP